jgi:hypothetical protein
MRLGIERIKDRIHEYFVILAMRFVRWESPLANMRVGRKSGMDENHP